MKIADFYKILKKSKLPIAYYAFPAGEAQATPFIVYYVDETHTIKADNANYFNFDDYAVELYTDKKDPAIEKKLEDIFTSHELVFEKVEAYIEEEKMLMVKYYLGGI